MRPILIASALAVTLTGCVQHNPNGYNTYAIQRAVQTETGTVTAIRSVQIASQDTGLGAALGAMAGGIAGSQIGPSSYSHNGHRHRYTSAGSALGALGGALVGGLIGAAIERDINKVTATEYVVQMDDGSTVTIVQENSPIAAGQRVLLQTAGDGSGRLVPAA